MNILEDKQLKNLSTERLVALKKQLNKTVGRRRHDVESTTIETTPEDFKIYHDYVDFAVRVKDILSDRENIDNIGRGHKHNHDKRDRRQGADRKRNY